MSVPKGGRISFITVYAMFKSVPSKINFPQMEEETLRFWKEKRIFQRSVEERRDAPLFMLYEGPPTANASPGIHHVLSRVIKDIIPRYKTMKGYCAPRKGGWDTHGLPVELEVEKELGISTKPEIESYGVDRFNQRCRQSVMRYVKEWEELTDRIAFWIDMSNAYVTFENPYIESCWWIIKQLWDRGLIYQDRRSIWHCPRCVTSLSDHEVALGYQENTPDVAVYVKFKLDPRSAQKHPKTKESISSSPIPVYFLAWTTTPWTLPGNTALAVAKDAEYALVEVGKDKGGGERLILAASLLDSTITSEYERVTTFKGNELVGLRYEALYDPFKREVWVEEFGKGDRRADLTFSYTPPLTYPVITGDFVSLEEGTGIVHIAPAFGADDYEAGKANDLYFVQNVNLEGKIIGNLPGQGMFVKDADEEIMKDLESRGLLLRRETISHTYPFCWRCSTPLIYYAKSCWYIRTTEIKENLLKANDKINWYPGYIKWGRFGDWLRNNVDWAISRERYWGTPIPIWGCEDRSCVSYECIGGLEELRGKEGVTGLSDALDLHKPFVDEITFRCSECGGTMRRIPEVMDVWFDSGAMPLAQWHYPFENSSLLEDGRFPADYICEAVDQTRGWFYSLHAVSTLLFDGPSYKNVICLGLILDSAGEKMSKSKGNVVDPWTVIDAHGADALRWYLFSASPPGNARRFSAELVEEAVRKFLLTLWNTYSFFVTYANIDKFDPSSTGEPTPSSDLDRWILSEMNHLIQEVTRFLDDYNPTDAARRIERFVDDLSNWYVRRSRRRFWKSENDEDKLSAYSTLYQCLVVLSKVLAPFTPFVADEMYRNLVVPFYPDAPESVHLASYPVVDTAKLDPHLETSARLVMKVSSLGRAARSKAGIRIRQPLEKVLVKMRSKKQQEALERLSHQVMDELNVKGLAFVSQERGLIDYRITPNQALLGPKYGKDMAKIARLLSEMNPGEVAASVRRGKEVPLEGYILSPEEILVTTLDKPGYSVVEEGEYLVAVTTEISPELAEEGLARELVHRLQTMRRSAGFDVADHIITYYQGDERIRRCIKNFASYIQQETLSQQLVEGAPETGAYVETHKLGETEIILGVRRVGY